MKDIDYYVELGLYYNIITRRRRQGYIDDDLFYKLIGKIDEWYRYNEGVE